jgi:hypothetical protein
MHFDRKTIAIHAKSRYGSQWLDYFIVTAIDMSFSDIIKIGGISIDISLD